MGAMAIGALYLHVPFCHAKCAYCDFDSRALPPAVRDAAIDRYLAQLSARLDALGRAGALEHVRTAYLGGGTPTVLGMRLPALVRQVRAWCDPVELTSEANPESFDDASANELAAAGVTRISLGVQSLNDDELAAIGRIHSAHEALAAIARAKHAGLAVSADLMCGLPGQTEESWRASLAGLVDAAPDHVSIYPLTIEEGTPLAARVERDPALEPDEDMQAWCMEEARRVLRAAGYAPYEVASYARPGRACRHNVAYWTGVSYLGVGRSAAGMFSAAELDQLRELFPGASARDALSSDGAPAARIRYVQTDDDAASFSYELLSEREAVAEDLMLGMRMTAGVSERLIERARAVIGAAPVNAAVDSLISDRLAAYDGADATGECRLAPTERGWLMGNELYERLWSLSEG